MIASLAAVTWWRGGASLGVGGGRNTGLGQNRVRCTANLRRKSDWAGVGGEGARGGRREGGGGGPGGVWKFEAAVVASVGGVVGGWVHGKKSVPGMVV